MATIDDVFNLLNDPTSGLAALRAKLGAMAGVVTTDFFTIGQDEQAQGGTVEVSANGEDLKDQTIIVFLVDFPDGVPTYTELGRLTSSGWALTLPGQYLHKHSAIAVQPHLESGANPSPGWMFSLAFDAQYGSKRSFKCQVPFWYIGNAVYEEKFFLMNDNTFAVLKDGLLSKISTVSASSVDPSLPTKSDVASLAQSMARAFFLSDFFGVNEWLPYNDPSKFQAISTSAYGMPGSVIVLDAVAPVISPEGVVTYDVVHKFGQFDGVLGGSWNWTPDPDWSGPVSAPLLRATISGGYGGTITVSAWTGLCGPVQILLQIPAGSVYAESGASFIFDARGHAVLIDGGSAHRIAPNSLSDAPTVAEVNAHTDAAMTSNGTPIGDMLAKIDQEIHGLTDVGITNLLSCCHWDGSQPAPITITLDGDLPADRSIDFRAGSSRPDADWRMLGTYTAATGFVKDPGWTDEIPDGSWFYVEYNSSGDSPFAGGKLNVTVNDSRVLPYSFTVDLPSSAPNKNWYGSFTNEGVPVDWGTGALVPYRPENAVLSKVADLFDAEFGKWEIVSSGAGDTLVMYREDGSVLKRFALAVPSNPPRAYVARTPL